MLLVSLAERVAFIERVFGKGGLTRDARNFDVRCPECNDPDRNKRKLSINTKNDLNQCWVCGWSARNLSPLIKKHGTPEDLREYVQNFIGKERFDPGEETIARPKLPDDFKLLAIESTSPMQRRVLQYLFSRGLTRDDLWRYRFGTSEEQSYYNRVIFPSFDAGGYLNYFVARSVEAGGLRYKNPPVDRREVIFNEMYIDWTKELILCEGAFDAVKCGDNVVPILGNRLSPRSRLFCRIVENSTPVVIALDNDMEERAAGLSELFEQYDVPVRVLRLGHHKDPGSMSKDEFANLLKTATQITWMDNFNRRLLKASGVRLNTGSR